MTAVDFSLYYLSQMTCSQPNGFVGLIYTKWYDLGSQIHSIFFQAPGLTELGKKNS